MRTIVGMKKFPTIYSRTKNGQVQTWRIEVEHDKFRTVEGLLDGALTTSAWTIAQPKNVGKKNETSGEEQALKQAAAKHKAKLEEGYHEKIKDIDIVKFFEPMTARKWKDIKKKVKFPVYTQPKLDGCLSFDTQIITKDGPLLIGEIVDKKLDIEVLSYNIKTKKQEFKKITNYAKNGVDLKEKSIKWYEIQLSNGESLKATGNHLVFLPKLHCWRRVDELIIDDILLKNPSNLGCIVSIKEIGPLDKFDIEVEGNNNFFANGILVHNCRCIVKESGMWSRYGKPILSAPHIFEQLKNHISIHPAGIFDGELYAHKYKNDFEKIISLARKGKPDDEELAESAKHLEYWVYDFFNENMPDMTLEERHESLKSSIHLIKSLNPKCKLVYVPLRLCKDEDELDEAYSEYLADGMEGQMIRIPGSKYENTRSNNLIKRKEFIDKEFKLRDVFPGVGGHAYIASKVECEDEEGRIFEAGMIGNHEYCAELLKNKENAKGKYVTIRFQRYTKDGVPRFGKCRPIPREDYE